MEQLQLNMNLVWTIMAALLVFLMQAGFSSLEAGLVRAKNSINVVMKNMMDITIIAILFSLIGFPLMFGPTSNHLWGSEGFFFQGFMSENNEFLFAFLLFQIVFAGTASTIVSGAVAERMPFHSYVAATVAIALLIYPVFGHWAWGNLFFEDQDGWLSRMGFMDFAGSTVVHSIGAWVALAGVIVIGPRLGKYNSDGTTNRIHGSNIPLASMGVFLLWFGWFGFNAGSTLTADASIAIIALNTMLAASAGAVGSLAVSWMMFRQPRVEYLLNGILAGLVGITAGCDIVSPVGAMLIGLISGIIVVFALVWIETKLKLDDAVGAISVHGVCGAWGTLALALFAPLSSLAAESRLEQVKIQIIGIGAAFFWAFIVGMLLFWLLKKTIGVRVDPKQEEEGLNVSEHGAKTALIETITAMHEISMAKGDLTRMIPVLQGEDTAQLNAAFNRMMDSLNEIVNAVKIESSAVMESGYDMQERSKSVQKNIESNYESVREMYSALQQMRAGIELGNDREEQFIETIHKSIDAFESYARNLAEMKTQGETVSLWMKTLEQNKDRSSASMMEAQRHMEQMKSFSTQVEEMNQMIYQLSEQIDLLSLNARIEAARAGEHGLGFSAVATEIQKLSIQTKESIEGSRKSVENHIKGLIKGIQHVDETNENLNQLFTSVEDTKEISDQMLVTMEMINGETKGFLTAFEHISNDSGRVTEQRQLQFEQLQEILSQVETIESSTSDMTSSIELIANQANQQYSRSKGLELRVSSFKTKPVSD